MSAYSILVLVHAGLGTLALATFWTAGLARKGSPVHVAAGRAYLLAMFALLLIAVPLSIATLLDRPVAGAFLLYLVVITGTAVWTSWRAVADKRDWARYTGRAYRGLMWANLASALAIGAVGVLLAQSAQVVIVSFAGIGLITFVRMWKFSRAAPAEPRWWMREHLLAMLGNGVATHIAFLSIGLPKLLPMLAGPTLQNLAWLGPVVVATAAAVVLTRKYLPSRATMASAAPRRPLSAGAATGPAGRG